MTQTQWELLRALLQSIDHNVARMAESCERCELRFTRDVPVDVAARAEGLPADQGSERVDVAAWAEEHLEGSFDPNTGKVNRKRNRGKRK